MREGSQNPPRFRMPISRQREAFQTDHGVSAPISKPVVTGNDGSRFITGGVRPRGILDASSGCDDELVCCEHQFMCRLFLCLRICVRNQPPMTIMSVTPRLG